MKDKYIEIESKIELLSKTKEKRDLNNFVIQGIDLREKDIEERLISISARNSYFLGCILSDTLTLHIAKTGGTIFPPFSDLDFNPYRPSLYEINELMQGYKYGDKKSFNDTIDGKIYQHYHNNKINNEPFPIIDALAYRIHDHAIDDALYDFLKSHDPTMKNVIGIMGGHALARDDKNFLKISQIAKNLAKLGFLIISGGGPGAMEAANLGAYMADYSDEDLTHAVSILSQQPKFIDEFYIDRAFDVTKKYKISKNSIAIPTWFYGHEPTNLFASHIAKYFSNSIREDGLLAIAKGGVIYAPGSAGTIQEIFMDVTQNHYGTFKLVSPMVFFDKTFWLEEKPVYEFLKNISKGKQYNDYLFLSDEIDEIVNFINEKKPVKWRK